MEQVRQAKELKRIENLQELLSWFDGAMYLKTRQSLARARLQQIKKQTPLTESNAPADAYRLLDFFEHVAWLAEKGYVSADDMWCAFYDPIIHLYADLEVLIKEERNAQTDNGIYAGLEKLVRKLYKVQTNQGQSPNKPNEPLIRRYYESNSALL
ncbi:MAG: hypothetical protein WA634_15770 [Silvibacterium sp.]